MKISAASIHSPSALGSLEPNNKHNYNKTAEVLAEAKNTITRFLRKSIANASYEHMFGNGAQFRSDGLYPSRPHSTSGLKYLEIISADCLSAIESHLGKLTEQEQRLLGAVEASTWKYRHHTNGCVENDNTLNLLSFNALQKNNIEHFTSTNAEDITNLSNTDFIFMAVQLDDPSFPSQIRSTLHCKIDYGATAFLIDETYPSHRFSYITLTDQLTSQVPKITDPYYKKYTEMFRIATKEACREIYQPNTEKPPIFSTSHMKKGVALYLIDFLRNTNDIAFRDALTAQPPSPAMLEFAMNCVFQLEFHIPRIVSTRDYLKIPVRKPDLYELIRASNLPGLTELLKTSSSEKVQSAIYEAQYQNNTTVLQHVANYLKNPTTTDEHSGLLEMYEHYFNTSAPELPPNSI